MRAAGQGFATTRWSLVLRAGNEEDPAESSRALEILCADYWRPLYGYVRSRGYGLEDARDMTQGFFLKLLEKQDLRVASPARGRFRTFLLTSMKNYLAGEWRRRQARKRGGDVEVLGFDFDSAEASYQLDSHRLEQRQDLDPEAIYHRRWALDLLERATDELRSQYAVSGKSDLFEALKGALAGESLTYSELAESFGQSEGALRTAASRLRSRWRRQIRQLVAETVEKGAEIEDELDHLITSVA